MKPNYKAIVDKAIGEKPSLVGIVPELRQSNIEEEIRRRLISDYILLGEMSPIRVLRDMLVGHVINKAEFDMYEKIFSISYDQQDTK